MIFNNKLFTAPNSSGKSLKLLLFVSVFVIFSSVSKADTQQSYSLNELIRAGLDHSTDKQVEELRLQISRSSLRTTYLDFLPSANINASRNYDGDFKTSSGFNISKSFYLNDPSYFNWRRTRVDWDNAQISYQENRRRTVFEIFSLYIKVVEAEKRVEIQRQNLAIQERIAEQMELLFRLEQRSLIELKQTQIALINAQIAFEDAQVQHKNTRENLFLYLNINDEGHPLEEIDIPIAKELPDYKNAPQIVMAENNLRKNEISLTQSRLNFIPSLSLTGTYSLTGEDKPFDFDGYRKFYTVSLSASYPLFNYIQHREQHHRSRRELMIQKLNLESMVANYKKQYAQMIRDLEREQRLYELAARREELAEEALELARSRFNLGVLSLLELDQAVKEYNESTIEMSNRYYQRLLKQEELNLFLSEPILGQW